MNIRFYETGLRQVASGLAKIARPTPDSIDHLICQLSLLAEIAADAGQGAVSGAAQTAQAAVQALGGAAPGARATSVEALAKLGQRLLGDLCTEVAQAKTDAPASPPTRRVLVVDDSRVATTALLGAFKARNFAARAAVTLEEVLVEIVLFTPQILVSDVFMPAIEVELIARVFRELSRGTPNLLVLVSSSTGAILNERLQNVKHDLFVSKMEGANKVVDKVAALCRDDDHGGFGTADVCAG